MTFVVAERWRGVVVELRQGMFETTERWLIVGLVGGILWGRYATWLGVPRRALVALAPIVATSLVLPLRTVGENWRDLWTFVPIVVAATPAVLGSLMATRGSRSTKLHGWRAVSAIALLPGVVLALLGLRPGSIRYADAVDAVNRARPFVVNYIRDHQRCPEHALIWPFINVSADEATPSADSLHFVCDAPRFGFCIRRHPYEESVQCWNSETGTWWFERTFLTAGPVASGG